MCMHWGSTVTKTQRARSCTQDMAIPTQTKHFWTAGELSTLEAFRKQFDDVSFEKGTEVVFSTTGKQLLTKVDNREKGMLMSPVLNRALLQVYLGPDSVTPESKKTFEVAMEALLNTSKL
uniref:Chalcone-flavonone isomerase family protein n=1 Tax=Dunaliella tertiolecta TaxID=3047 RepID=A0A7S3VIK9_DUNTE